MYATTSPRASMHARKPSSSIFNSNPDSSVSSGSASHNHIVSRAASMAQPALILQPPTPQETSRPRPPRDSLIARSVYSDGRESSTIRLPSQRIPPPGRGSFIPHAFHDERGSIRPPSPLPGGATYPNLQTSPLRDSEHWQSLPIPPMGMAAQGRSLEPEYSYIDGDVEESMQIRPGEPQYRDSGDSEFARRPPGAALSTPRRLSPPRKSRFRRFLSVCASPFRAVANGFRQIMDVAKGLLGKREGPAGANRPVTASSGWDFRDPTPAPASIRQSYIRDENEGRRAPVTVVDLSTAAERERSNGNHESRSETSTSRSSRSRSDHRSPSHYRSEHGHDEPAARTARDDAPPPSATTQTHPFSPGVRSSIAIAPALSPTTEEHTHLRRNRRDDRVKRRRRQSSTVSGRDGARSSSWSQSTRTSISQGVTSLLQLFLRVRQSFLRLYNLPWIAAPTKRVAVDFIPALASGRSRYRVHRPRRRSGSRGALLLPVSVVAAANEAEKMEPSDGRSWYRPSAQQIEKRRAKMIDFEERGIKPKRSHTYREFHPSHGYHTHTYGVPYMCSLDMEHFGHPHAQHHPHFANGLRSPHVTPPGDPYASRFHDPRLAYMLPPTQMAPPMPLRGSPPRPPGLAYSNSLRMPVPSMPHRNISLHSHRNGSDPPTGPLPPMPAHVSSESSNRSDRRPPMPALPRPGPQPLQNADSGLPGVDPRDPRQQVPYPGYMYPSSSGQAMPPREMYPLASWVPAPGQQT